MITCHTVVNNEGKFIKSALLAALSSRNVVRALVWDTGSSDDTVQQIRSISDTRIEFSEKGKVDRTGLVKLRNEQLQLTRTPWFLLVDGDEIWPEKNLEKLIQAMKKSASGTIALVNRTRNAVGDFYHYLPESAGHYRIGTWTGHLNIRAIRNLRGLTVKGEYPNEWYELDGKKIQDQPERLEFINAWYLHTTHLKRSTSWASELTTTDRWKKHKWFWKLRGTKLLTMMPEELPEVLKNTEGT